MKHAYFAIIIAFFGVFLSYSCSKDSLNSDSTTILDTEKITPRDWGLNRQWYDNEDPDGEEGVDWGCRTPPISCWDDIIVTGSKLTVTNDIFSHNNVWDTGELEDFADEYSTELNDIIGSAQTFGVISGTYVLRTRATILHDHRYIIVKQGSSIIYVASIDN